MLLTSIGRAYFAFCSQSEREEVLAQLQAEAAPEAVLARDAVWVARMLAQTQAQGYGQRDPSIAGEGVGQRLMADDGRNSIAVPVIVAGQVLASLNLTWTRRATNASQIVGEHLEALRAAAAETVVRLSARQGA